MPRRQPKVRGIALSRLLVILVVGGCAAIVTPRVYNFDRCGQPGAAPCPAADEPEFAVGESIPRAQACANAGYLCKEDGAIDLTSVARWRTSRGRLRVRLPLSRDIPEELARTYRAAAVRGIMQWAGHPFRFDIDSGAVPTQRWDVEVFWTYTLSGVGNYAGLARLQRARDNPELQVRVISVVTSFASWEPGSDDAIAEVTTVTAHEMGHALGLGHSDDARDVMSAGNNGRHNTVSARDLQSIEALYRLPIGATVAR